MEFGVFFFSFVLVGGAFRIGEVGDEGSLCAAA